MERIIPSTHTLRASASLSASVAVTFSPTSLLRFADTATFYFDISGASSLDLEIELQRSPDGTTWRSAASFGPYTANQNAAEDLNRMECPFGMYQRLYLTVNSGSCTLAIHADIVEEV